MSEPTSNMQSKECKDLARRSPSAPTLPFKDIINGWFKGVTKELEKATNRPEYSPTQSHGSMKNNRKIQVTVKSYENLTREQLENLVKGLEKIDGFSFYLITHTDIG